jgi:hypothetical protein
MNPIIKKIQDHIDDLQMFVDCAIFPKSREQQSCEQEIRETIVFLKELLTDLNKTL